MKNKLKKIMATTLISMTASTAIGCATSNTKIAQKINNGLDDFVSSINNLDYVDTNNNANLGKIVSAANENNFYNKVTSTANIENTITRPTERGDNFKLYILSESPYISLTSDDNNNLNLTMQLSTEKIETASDSINEKINKLILKRAILMIYVNEIYSGNVNLSEENKKSINAYVNIIKENASFLNGNRGMVKNQLGMASDLINNKTEDTKVNYYIIKSGEALEIRSNKIDSTISAIDSIISILEQNLTSSSCYYQNNLTSSYQQMISNMENNVANSENDIVAKNIAESINLISLDENNNVNQRSTTYPSARNTQNITNKQTISPKNCIDCDKINTTNTNKENINQNITTLENIEEDNYLKNTNRNISNINKTNQNNINSNIAETNRTKNIKKRLLRKNNINNLNNTTTQTNPNNVIYPSSSTTNKNLKQVDQSTLNNSLNANLQENRATRVPYKTSININK